MLSRSPIANPEDKGVRGGGSSRFTLMELLVPSPSDSSRSNIWSLRTRVVAGFTVVAIIFALLLTVFLTYRGGAKDIVTCRTDACLEYASLFTKSINRSVSPCDNFYRHVCDGWKKSNVYSVHETALDSFVRLLSDYLVHLEAPDSGQSAIQKAARYFKSCTQSIKGDRGEITRMIDILGAANLSWPHMSKTKPDVLSSIMYISRVLGFGSILYFWTSIPKANSRAVGIEPDYGIEEVILRRKQLKDNYGKFYESMATTFSGGRADGVKFDRFQVVEDDVLATLPDVSGGRTRLDTYELPTLASNVTRAFSVARWEAAIKANYDLVPGSPIITRVRSEDYIAAFSDLVLRWGESIIHMYVGWMAIQRIPAVLNRNLFESFLDVENIRPNVSTYRCLRLVEDFMGWALVAGYVETVESADVQRDVRELTTRIRSSASSVTASNWTSTLTDKTLSRLFWIRSKYNTVEELDGLYGNYSDMGLYVPSNIIAAVKGFRSTDPRIGAAMIPEYFVNYTTAPLFDMLWRGPVWDEHRSDKLELVIKPHYLLYPIYDIAATRGIKYGALGSLLARGFVVDYTVSQNASLQQASIDMAGTACKRDYNLAMSEAVISRIALQDFLWKAFKDAIGDTDMRLHGFTDYSEPAIFFFVQCFLLCSKADLENERRCNEPLRHNPQFANTLHCMKGTAMNPTDCISTS